MRIDLIKRLFAAKGSSPEPRVTESAGDVFPLRIPGLAGGLVMRVHDETDLHVSRQIRSEGIWESDETGLLISLLGEGQTFVDVGANIGYFTLLGSRLVGPAGRVYAFEPDPVNCQLLLENCQLNKIDNARIEQVALSDHEGTGELFLSEDNLGDHTIYSGLGNRRKRDIRLINGSRYFEDVSGHIDLIKIDVQGAEFHVLKGLQSALRESLPGLILVLEFSPNSLKVAGSSGEELLELLLQLNLKLYIFDHRHLRLLSAQPQDIIKWVRLTQMDSSSEGFINLVCSGDTLSNRAGLNVESNAQGEFDPLEYLLASHLRQWDGARCDVERMKTFLYLSRGWCFPEPWGVWSDGRESRIRFYPIAPASHCDTVELCFEGQYYGAAEHTQVLVNQQLIGEFDLVSGRVSVPAATFRQDQVEIALVHKRPRSPRELEGAEDDRQIKYGLRSLAWTAL